MMIDRTQLIERLRAEMKERQGRAELDFDKAQAAHEQANAEYVESTADAWAEFLHHATQAVRDDRPVTPDMVPEALRDSPSGRYLRWPPTTQPKYKPADVSDLARLIGLLEASKDEKVSSRALIDLGFRNLFQR